MIRAVLLLTLIPMTGQAEMAVQAIRYTCDRGVEVPVVTVIGEADDGIAVLTADGRQIQLYLEPAASGARYGWPSDGSNHVWWTKGTDATLLWKDGEAKTETPILACTEAP